VQIIAAGDCAPLFALAISLFSFDFPLAGLLQNCTSSLQCDQQDAKCVDGTCECKEGFVINPAQDRCLKGKTLLQINTESQPYKNLVLLIFSLLCLLNFGVDISTIIQNGDSQLLEVINITFPVLPKILRFARRRTSLSAVKVVYNLTFLLYFFL